LQPLILAAICLLAAGCSDVEPAPAASTWRELAPGMDLAEFGVGLPTALGDSTVVVLRVDPIRWDIRLCCATQEEDGKRMTAEQWCESRGLVAAINAGMYATDYRTHVGYLRSGSHVNSSTVNRYKSVAAFDPVDSGSPAFRIFDLDAGDSSLDAINEAYGSVVQNLRLIKRPGSNRWEQQEKRWSEAALGEDEQGRALLIFCRSPYAMHDLNNALLGLPLDLVAAQHLEGGPEAQLFVRTGDVEVDLIGSYETGFSEQDGNRRAWPIPNVIGIAPQAGGAGGEQRDGSRGKEQN
jgi:hypothetical protein